MINVEEMTDFILEYIDEDITISLCAGCPKRHFDDYWKEDTCYADLNYRDEKFCVNNAVYQNIEGIVREAVQSIAEWLE